MLIKTNEVSAFRYGHQIIGTRPEQEDCFATLSLGGKGSLLVLADGMGGHSDGEKASACVVNDIVRTFRAAQEPFLLNLAEVAEHANAALGKEKQANRIAADAGCTLIIVRISPGAFDYLSIGDSYLFYQAPGHGLYKRNKLHTVAVELEERGIPKEEIEANPKRKALTCAVMGRQLTRDPHIGSIPLAPGGRILVTSDGLLSLSHGKVDAYLRATAPNPQGDIADIVTTLLDAVVKLNRERQDNTTVVGYQEPPEGTSADTPAAKKPGAVDKPSPATGKSRKLSLTLPAACLLSCIGTLALCAVAWSLYTPQEAQPPSVPRTVSSVIIEQTRLTQLRYQLHPEGQQDLTPKKYYENACACTNEDIKKILASPTEQASISDRIKAISNKKNQLRDCVSELRNNNQAETENEEIIHDALTEALHFHTQDVDGPKIKNDIQDANQLQELCNNLNKNDAFLQGVFANEIKANEYLKFALQSDNKANWVDDTSAQLKKIDGKLGDKLKEIVQTEITSQFKDAVQTVLNEQDFNGFREIVHHKNFASPLDQLFKEERNVLGLLDMSNLQPNDNDCNTKAITIINTIKEEINRSNTTCSSCVQENVQKELAEHAFERVWTRILNIKTQKVSVSIGDVVNGVNKIQAQPELTKGFLTKLRTKLEGAQKIVSQIENSQPSGIFAEDAAKFNFDGDVDATLKPFIKEKAAAFMWHSVEKSCKWPTADTNGNDDILKNFYGELDAANNQLKSQNEIIEILNLSMPEGTHMSDRAWKIGIASRVTEIIKVPDNNAFDDEVKEFCNSIAELIIKEEEISNILPEGKIKTVCQKLKELNEKIDATWQKNSPNKEPVDVTEELIPCINKATLSIKNALEDEDQKLAKQIVERIVPTVKFDWVENNQNGTHNLVLVCIVTTHTLKKDKPQNWNPSKIVCITVTKDKDKVSEVVLFTDKIANLGIYCPESLVPYDQHSAQWTLKAQQKPIEDAEDKEEIFQFLKDGNIEKLNEKLKNLRQKK